MKASTVECSHSSWTVERQTYNFGRMRHSTSVSEKIHHRAIDILQIANAVLFIKRSGDTRHRGERKFMTFVRSGLINMCGNWLSLDSLRPNAMSRLHICPSGPAKPNNTRRVSSTHGHTTYHLSYRKMSNGMLRQKKWANEHPTDIMESPIFSRKQLKSVLPITYEGVKDVSISHLVY